MSKKVYALIGISVPLLFIISYLTISISRSEFNHFRKAISELGSINAPHMWLWNLFGYIFPGALIAVFSFGFYRNFISHQIGKWPFYFLAISGLLMAFAGIFPGDFDNKQSATMFLHSLGSFGSYLFFLAAAFTLPKQLKGNTYWKPTTQLSLIFTWLSIFFGAWPFVFKDYPALGQRFVFLFYFLWIYNNAYKLYKQPINSDSK